MITLLYCDSNQEKLRNMVFAQNHDFTCITNTFDLNQNYHTGDYPILVLLSQPTKQMMMKMMSLRWSSIISFIGVRIEEKWESNLLYFEDEIEFDKVFKECLRNQRYEFEKHYIEQLGELSEEDQAYIGYLSGHSSGSVKKAKTFKNMIYRKEPSLLSGFGLVTVMGNSEIVFQLAKSCSKHTKERVLVIDGDLMNPSLESYFKISKTSTRIKSHLSGVDNSGINIALDTISKGFDLDENIYHMTHYGGKNMRVMLGNYNVYNYEHYDIKQIKSLLTKLLKMFGTIILAVNGNPYDNLTMLGLHMSKINLIACKNDQPSVRYIYSLLKVLKSKQGLSHSKNLIVSYTSGHGLQRTSPLVLNELFGNNYFGHFNPSNFFSKKVIRKLGERSISWD